MDNSRRRRKKLLFGRALKGFYKSALLIARNHVVVIALMAVCVTAWGSWETREARLLEAGPNISVSDVILLEQVQSAYSDQNQAESERTEAAPMNIALRFKNTGKKMGFIRLLNSSELLPTTSDPNITQLSTDSKLVPSEGETEQVFKLNIGRIPPDASFPYELSLDYRFLILDQNLKKLGQLQFTVQCKQLNRKTPMGCGPNRGGQVLGASTYVHNMPDLESPFDSYDARAYYDFRSLEAHQTK